MNQQQEAVLRGELEEIIRSEQIRSFAPCNERQFRIAVETEAFFLLPYEDEDFTEVETYIADHSAELYQYYQDLKKL